MSKKICVADYNRSKIKMQNKEDLIIGFASVCAYGSESELVSVQGNERIFHFH